MSYPVGKFAFKILLSGDPVASERFYGELFGWNARDYDMGLLGTFRKVSTNGVDICGFVDRSKIPMDQAGMTSGWVSTCIVEDVDATTLRVEGLGGAVIAPPADVYNTGRVAILRDPLGAVIALFRGIYEPPPTWRETPPAGQFHWDELRTSDPDRVAAFYTALFGWTVETIDTAAGPYHVFKRGDVQASGMRRVEGAPPTWITFVGVDDLDASTARAVRLGAEEIETPAEIPTIGRASLLSAPDGAGLIGQATLDPRVLR